MHDETKNGIEITKCNDQLGARSHLPLDQGLCGVSGERLVTRKALHSLEACLDGGLQRLVSTTGLEGAAAQLLEVQDGVAQDRGSRVWGLAHRSDAVDQHQFLHNLWKGG
jgi:hypothetical protein